MTNQNILEVLAKKMMENYDDTADVNVNKLFYSKHEWYLN